MARFDPEHSTDGGRRQSMLDVHDLTCPTTIGYQLRNDGYEHSDRAQGSQGMVTVPPRYPLAGNAGFDTDNDADDYNTAVYGQPASTTSSSGPP